MPDSLSIRSYSKQTTGHSHDFHQLVLPLSGVINIAAGDIKGKVAPGECVVIRRNTLHIFTAEEQARFVVADLHELPDNLSDAVASVFAVSKPMTSLLSFIATQLEHRVSSEVETLMLQTFLAVLAEQEQGVALDPRIRNVVEFIEIRLSESLTIEDMASVACMSGTQFKKIFRAQTGKTPARYITALRMEKARALLIHTDMPVQRVAEEAGYQDLSAFSRRFSAYFGLPPSKMLQ